ncbi:MAG: hypothetical protein ACRD0G_19115 [Acidimicrobiales bacterium]
MNEPVAIAVTRRVRAGHEAGFEAWAHRVVETAEGFESFVGAELIRPASGAPRDYVVALRFGSAEALAGWEASTERAQLLAELDASRLVEGDARVMRTPGVELWFTAGASGATTPPRWRIAIATWAVIAPVGVASGVAVHPLVESWHPLAAGYTMAGIAVPAMVWFVMPTVTRVAKRFLFPSGDG